MVAPAVDGIDLITLSLIAGAVLLENVWYDCRVETLDDLANELRRAEASRWVQRAGRTLAISLRVALTIGAAWLFTLPVVQAMGGLLALALATYLTFTIATDRPEPAIIGQVKASYPLTLIGALVRVEVGRDLPAILVVGVLCTGNGWAAFLGSVVGSMVVLIRSVSLPTARLPWLRYPALALLVFLGARMPFQDHVINQLQSLLTAGDPPVPLLGPTLLLAFIFALTLLLLVVAIKFPAPREHFLEACGAYIVGGVFFGITVTILAGLNPDPLGVAIFLRILFTLAVGYLLLLFTLMLTGFWVWVIKHRDYIRTSFLETGIATIFASTFLGMFALVLIPFLPVGLAEHDPYLLVLRNAAFQQHSIVILTNQDTLQVVRETTIFSGDTVHFENETQQIQMLCLGTYQDCGEHTNGPQALQAPGLRLSPGQIANVLFPKAGEYHITCLSPPWLDLTVQVNAPQSNSGGD